MKAKTAAAIKIGDRVRVVVPEFFVRCGYPMDYHEEVVRVRKEKEKEIMGFLRSLGVGVFAHPNLTMVGDPPALDKIARAVAYDLCKQARFGGRERKIYRESVPDKVGGEFTVAGVRFCKTGTYTPGSRITWDSDDYDPPYLADEKTHRILDTNIYRDIPEDDTVSFLRGHYFLRIEAANVEHVAS